MPTREAIQIDSVTRAFCRTTRNANASCDIQAGIPSADVHFRCFADSNLSLDPVAYIGGGSYSCGYGAFVEHFLYLGQVCRSALSVDYWYDISSCNEGISGSDSSGRSYCGEVSATCYSGAGCWLDVRNVETEANPFMLEPSCLFIDTPVPTDGPTREPSPRPTMNPTVEPSSRQAQLRTPSPTASPSENTTPMPVALGTDPPTFQPSTASPTSSPTIEAPIAPKPTIPPISQPISLPTQEPSPEPTFNPTVSPTCTSWDCHCKSKNNSDIPCLPRIQDALGHGFNAVTGVTTQQVIKLDVEHTNEFTHSIMGTMQIPGNVDCTDLSYTRREKASTLFFESSEEYRHHIAVRKGLFGTIKESHKQKSSQGTHVVEAADFGGSLVVTASAQACFLKYDSQYNVSSAVSAAFWRLVGERSQISVQLQDGCDVQIQLSVLGRDIDGGDLSSLPSSDSPVGSVDPWYESISEKPAPIKLQVTGISNVVEGIFDFDVLDYTQRFEDPDDLTIVDPSQCLPECASQPSGSKNCDGDWLPTLLLSALGYWVFLI